MHILRHFAQAHALALSAMTRRRQRPQLTNCARAGHAENGVVQCLPCKVPRQGCQNYFAIYPSTRLKSPNIKIRRKSEVASDTEYRIKNGVANLHFTASAAYGIADVHLIDCWPRILVVGDRNNAILARSRDTAVHRK